jgi:hypothetical protein
METTYEITLSDGRTLRITAESYEALSSASFHAAEHSRFVPVQLLSNGQAADPARLVVNVDHVVTARQLRS